MRDIMEAELQSHVAFHLTGKRLSGDLETLDDNVLAAGKKFSQVGDWSISPNGSRLAYLHDTTAHLFGLPAMQPQAAEKK